MIFAVLHLQALDIQQKPCAYIALRTRKVRFYLNMSAPVNLFMCLRGELCICFGFTGVKPKHRYCSLSSAVQQANVSRHIIQISLSF